MPRPTKTPIKIAMSRVTLPLEPGSRPDNTSDERRGQASGSSTTLPEVAAPSVSLLCYTKRKATAAPSRSWTAPSPGLFAAYIRIVNL
jgi:hypothetical protein